MNLFQRFGVAVKAAATSFVMSFGRASARWGWGRYGTNDGLEADYARLVGSGRGNSIVASVLGWLGRKFPNGTLALNRLKADGTKEQVLVHEFLALLRHPTRYIENGVKRDYYSGSVLLVAAHADWVVTGNGYLLKVRSAADRVVQLWYAPSRMVEPISEDPRVFVQYYRYRPNGDESYDLRPQDVVHFRNGVDPENPRLGLSPLGAMIREIYTDAEASIWTAAMLRNGGNPGVIISPDGDTEVDPETAEAIKTEYQSRFGGASRGAPLVMSSKMKVDRLSFSPNDMSLRELRAIPEERITAVLGVPAIVVGMGAGLDSSSYNNLSNLREVAIEDNLLPTYYQFAEQLQSQLLPDFEGDPDQFEVFFDVSGIRELQPDEDKMVARETQKLLAGGITLDEYRTNVGEDALDGDAGKVLYVPINVVPSPLDQIIPVAPEATPPPTATDVPVQGAGYDSLEVKAMSVLTSIERFRARMAASEARTLTARLTAQRVAAVDAVVTLLEAKDQAFEDRLRTRLESIFTNGIKSDLARLYTRSLVGTYEIVGTGFDMQLAVPDRLRQQFLRNAGRNVEGITNTTFEALNKTIRASQFAGESTEELTARIHGLGVFSEVRAETISRTELAMATNDASIEAYDQSEVVQKVRIHDGTHWDEPCASLNGHVVSLSEARNIPSIEHPRCLIGDTEVIAPNVNAAFSRSFEGEVLVLRTASDDFLTVTPNHPILTDRGWVAAGQMHEGEYVMRSLDSERIFRLVDPDHDYIPTLIKDVADSLGPASGGSATRVPGSPEDFHGDGSDGDVYVVRTDGLVQLDWARCTFEPIIELPIQRADVTQKSLAAGGLFDEVFPSFRNATDGSMRSGGIGTATIGADTLVPNTSSLGARASNSCIAEPRSDLSGARVDDGGDLVGAKIASDVQFGQDVQSREFDLAARWAQRESATMKMPHERGLPDVDSVRDIMSRFAGLVSPVEIIEIKRRQFSGHVYNLETAQGWYIASNIITHNCSRRFEPLIEMGARSMNGNGHVEEKVLVEA